MTGKRLILSIDLGTSGPKVAFFTLDGRLVAAQSEPVALHLFPGGGAEQEPDEWWAAIARAVHRLLVESGEAIATIAAIGVTAQWGGTVAVDAAGRALGNAIIWADSRGAPYVRAITGGWPTVDGYGVDKAWHWLRRTGGIPTRGGKDPIAHVLWLKHERPEVYRAAAKFLDIKDYINLRLAGRVASSPDTTTILWVTDNRRVNAIDYDPTLLRLSGLDRAALPDLLPAASVLGGLGREAGNELGLPAGIPVAVSSGDIMAAAVGSGAVREFEPHIHIGTSSWLSCHMRQKRTDLFHNMAALPSALPGLYLLSNEQDVAGGALVWLRDRVFFADDSLVTPAPANPFARFDALAAQAAPGCGGLIFAPWLNGERSPVEENTLGAGWHNLSLRTSRADMVRSVFEGVALNTRWLQGYVEKLVGRRLDRIRMVGGGARSALWCQVYADVLGRTVLQVADPQACSGRGAALLASLAIGGVRVEEIADAVTVAQEYTPNPTHRPVYDLLFREFVQIYKQNRAIHARLNRRQEPK